MNDAKKGRNKHVGPRAERPIWVGVTDAERLTITETARAVRLPVSALLRKLALGYQPPSLIDQETLLTIIKLRGDFGRLGGLLKLWLVEEPGRAVSDNEVRAALDMILMKQSELTDLISQLSEIIPAKP
ncbi:conjugal transfer protein TraJ [Gluconobacter cerevisiae]|uniref:Conjugal transfer protein TraJ n=1 Tax=Gluconobacter cerevisiae TaxID=1379734 RepID=A0ABR9YE60_9PROT|nr:conjugal transfer protein TraJ [Gluconobacter cerevisiae]MBF0876832.1 conjugal transfer protein TraJ [Gluconobacter cerevisiae]